MTLTELIEASKNGPVYIRQQHPDYRVAFILEDRNSMVKKWRELGFKCLQVADGDF